MKTITILLTLMFLNLALPAVQAQEETVWDKIERLEQEREQIKTEEKASLKKKVERINQRRENGELSREEARNLKEEAAKEHAMNIENRVAIIDNKIALLSRGDDEDGFDDEDDEDSFWSWEFDSDKRKYNRTTTHLVLAAGFNNALQEGQSINDSDFEIAGSRFFEIGIDWKTRVFENSNWLRFRYGFSFQFNGLKPTDNRYFVEDENLTQLVEHPMDLDKSKFRMDNLVIPVHFEFGPSVRQETDSDVYFSDYKKFKVGLGGYAGLNIGERQKLKYSRDGDNVKEKNKNDFNTNDFVYGLSAYVGWSGTYLYAKYDLNPIFDDPNVELNNVSVGLRLDLN
ncbi:hypothetical protein GCM10007103_05330 [Salinimicrobium marinum]|uniref:Outer membrane protein beta-barrel domain-containing protein n=1 Tax=Salinimicrobium marinum TaxID=680283 RepID=A0A918S6V7_9FLAO|nr:hypothetical protein [Salinimicrobium marinum]GHA26878.1 hypothetical protein GCM10007103_05330 [Salinimicrobium marinum]